MKKKIIIPIINAILFILLYFVFENVINNINDDIFLTLDEEEFISGRVTFIIISIGLISATLCNTMVIYLLLRLFSNKKKISIIMMYTLLLFLISALFYNFGFSLLLISFVKIILFNLFFQDIKNKDTILETFVISLCYTVIDYFIIQFFY